MTKIKIKEILKDGLRFLRENPIIFVVSFLIALSTSVSERMMSFSVKYAIFLFFIFFINLFLGAVIVRFVYEVKTKSIFSWREIIKFVLSKYFLIIIATIIFYVLMALGSIALIIPGIFLMIKLMFYEYGILLDNEKAISSLKRSWRITKGNWWQLLFLGLIFVTLIMLTSIIIGSLPPELSNVLLFLTFLFVIPWQYSCLTFAYLQLREEEINNQQEKI